MLNCFKYIWVLTTFKIFFTSVFCPFPSFSLLHSISSKFCNHQHQSGIYVFYAENDDTVVTKKFTLYVRSKWENNPCEYLAVWDFATDINGANMLLFPWYSPFHLHRFIVKNGGAQGKNVILFTLHSTTEIQALGQRRMPAACVGQGWRTEEGGGSY